MTAARAALGGPGTASTQPTASGSAASAIRAGHVAAARAGTSRSRSTACIRSPEVGQSCDARRRLRAGLSGRAAAALQPL